MTPAVNEVSIIREDGSLLGADDVVERAVHHTRGNLNVWLIMHGHESTAELERISGGVLPAKAVFCPDCNLFHGLSNGVALVRTDGENNTKKDKIECEESSESIKKWRAKFISASRLSAFC